MSEEDFTRKDWIEFLEKRKADHADKLLSSMRLIFSALSISITILFSICVFGSEDYHVIIGDPYGIIQFIVLTTILIITVAIATLLIIFLICAFCRISFGIRPILEIQSSSKLVEEIICNPELSTEEIGQEWIKLRDGN